MLQGAMNTVLVVVGALVGVLGVAVVLLAFFRDRPHGRRRCPKCWYDMTGVPGLLCPECGRTAKRERGLLRTRRRWGWAAAGVLVVALGVGTALVPKMRRDGWPSVVPTAALVWFVPPADQCHAVNTAGGAPSLKPVPAELQRRLAQGNFAAWEWRVLLRRSRVIRMREKWPKRESWKIGVFCPPWFAQGVRMVVNYKASGWYDGVLNAGEFHAEWPDRSQYTGKGSAAFIASEPVGNGALAVEANAYVVRDVPLSVTDRLKERPGGLMPIRSGWETLARLEVKRTIALVDSLDEVVTPVRDEGINARVRSALSVRLSPVGSSSLELILDLDRSKLGEPAPALGWHAELLRDGKVVTANVEIEEPLSFQMPPPVPRDDSWRLVFLSHEFSLSQVTDPADLDRWTVRVHGVPTGLTDWNRTSYWAGDLEYQARDLVGVAAAPGPSPGGGRPTPAR